MPCGLSAGLKQVGTLTYAVIMQVHRDKSGKEVSEEELKAAKDAERKAKEWVAPEWAGGVKQQREAEAQRAEMAAQAALPFARTRWVLHVAGSHRQRRWMLLNWRLQAAA